MGKDGGNPNYRKNVIQLEKERIEKERQELLMKRKRNSNYIQKCIKHGNEYYNHDKLGSLCWLKKESQKEVSSESYKLDDKNMQILKKKQEILAKYTQISQENVKGEDGIYRFSMVKGNNSALVKLVLTSRENWQELEQKHLSLFHFKWAPTSRYINFEQQGMHGQKKLVNHIERHD